MLSTHTEQDNQQYKERNNDFICKKDAVFLLFLRGITCKVCIIKKHIGFREER